MEVKMNNAVLLYLKRLLNKQEQTTGGIKRSE